MHEAAVQIRPPIPIAPAGDMPERLYPMRVIQMPVEPKDLAENGLNVVEKGLWETTFLANPVMTSELGDRVSEVSWAEGDGSGGAGGVEAARWVGRGTGWDRSVGGKCLWVVDLADDPALDERDVLGRRDFDRDLIVVEPGVGVATIRGLVQAK